MRSGLDESHSFNGYLFKIAQNDIYNLFRKRINEKYYQEYFLEYAEKLECSLEDKINYNELVEIIDQLIEELPDRRKIIFTFSRKEGLTYREIADKLDISENTVDTQIRKALDYIRQHLRNKYFSLTR
jgi:RNA polymerase sigma-70 factor (ECF subfamily)